MKWIFSHRKQIAVIVWAAIILLAIPMVSSISVADLLSFTPASPLLAALVLIGIYCVKAVIMAFPIVVLYIGAGVMFPPFWAVVITLVGAFCEAAIGYLIGRKMGRSGVDQLMARSDKAARFFAYHDANNTTTCFLARILPIPFDLVSLFLGASGMGFARYALFTLLGLCPFLIPWVLAGNAILTPFSKEFLIPFAISIAASVAAFLILRRLQKQREA